MLFILRYILLLLMPSKLNMNNKVIIITGASSGIGKALVELYYHKGALVVMAARNLEKMNDVIRQLNATKDRILAVQADVSKEEDCKILIEKAIEKFSSIDVLINNAGISMRALFEYLDLNVIRKVMDINFWGTVYCTKYALPYLLKSKGSVVGVSSVAGYKGLPGRSGYSASKFAMHGFLEVLRIENLKKGLHVLVACPGFTSSNIRFTALGKDGSQQGETPLNEDKLMTSEEVAKHIYHAVLKRKRDIVLTGLGRTTVFMNKFFPSFMDKKVYDHFAKEPDSPLNSKG